MTFTKHIPNALTSLNLLMGTVAIALLAVDPRWSFYCILAGAVFDFFDGFAARLLKAYSPIGKELDSLADLITFGLAPSFMLFDRYSKLCAESGVEGWTNYLPYASFLLVVFSALRLAKFNIDERQSTSFIGLPTPANALFWSSMALYAEVNISAMACHGLALALILLFSYMMVAEVPMFSFKTKAFASIEGLFIGLLLAGALALTILFGGIGLGLSIVWYITLSLIRWAMTSAKPRD